MSAELMLLIAQAMPEELLLEQLSEKLSQHKILKTEETRKFLHFHCHLILYKSLAEEKGVEAVVKEVGEMKAIHERMNSAKG